MSKIKNLFGGIFNQTNKNKIYNKSFIITEKFLNKMVLVYNGKEFKKVHIDREKLGFRFGEFVMTRKYTKKSKPIKTKKK
jgi:ribosomal protein S19